MSKRTSTKRISTKKEIKFDFVPPVQEYSFPSSWFESNKKAKPNLTIKSWNKPLEDLNKIVKGGIQAGTLTLDTAKLFIYQVGKGIKSQCDEDITTFGIQVTKKNQEVTPWDLVTVLEDGKDYIPPEQEAGGSQDYTSGSMLLYILSVYRLSKATVISYKDVLEKKMSQVALAQGGQMDFSGVVSSYSVWTRDPGFTKMVAAIDMYFYIFKNHELSYVKLATMGSRYKDCAALTTFGYGMKILRIGPYELMDWAFLESIGDELERITKIGEESTVRKSYFPYQADLCLVDRTAYSSVVNPDFFHLIHFVGCLLGHKRSMNARFTLESCLSDVALNACLIAWVFGQGSNLKPQYSPDGDDYAGEVTGDMNASGTSQEEEVQDIDELIDSKDDQWTQITGRDPSTWFVLLKTDGFKLPKVVLNKIKVMKSKITETREGSIGEYIKNRFPY